MSSHPSPETPGSAPRPRAAGDSPAPPPEAAAGDGPPPGPLPSTDDTPTIITRHLSARAALPVEDPAAGIRGRRLAHFELIEPIGVGGMAAVLRARDTQLDRFVALKILPPETAGDPENVRRFHQEARSAAKLDHENIARVFYCGEDQRLHFIAFEFVEGENLRTILDRRGRLPVHEAIHYMLQVAAGLAHASRRGVVHRDIKPSNIIITPNGRAKLVDMGLARSQEPRGDRDLTQSGVTLGTFDYISPEQALEPREADVRSDIYSLGCTFYHVLTGWPPVPDGTAAKKLHHQQHVRPVDPRHYVPDLPLEVVQILDRMMAKDPGDRYQSPEQLVHQLLLAAKQLGATPEVPEGVLSFEADLPAAPAGRPLAWAAVAAALVIGLVLLLDQVPTGQPVEPARREAAGEANEGKAPAGAGAALAKGADDPTPAKGAGEAGQAEARYEAPDDASLTPQQRAQHLLAWLGQQPEVQSLVLALAGEIDLSGLQGEARARGLVLSAAQKVTIRPRRAGEPVTVRFNYDSAVASKALVALTLQAKETAVEGVRFVVDAHESDVALTALRLLGARHHVQRCEFVQARPATRPDTRFASVHADAGPGSSRRPAALTLSDCAFLGFARRAEGGEGDDPAAEFQGAGPGGQVAIVRDGPVRVTAEGCVFGPHAAVARLEGSAPGDAGQVTFRHCTLMLAARRSAAFDVPAGAAGTLGAHGCLVARMPGETEAGAVLIRQAGEGGDAVTFQGSDNCYHDLDGYWAVREGLEQAGWGDFRYRVGKVGNKDDNSRVALSSPWRGDAAEQLRLLEQGQGEGRKLAPGFEVNLRLAALRRPAGSGAEVVGATKVLGESWLPDSLPALDEKPDVPPRRLLVVEGGSGEDDPTNGVYASLEAAVLRARPFDTVLLRFSREIRMDPVQLNKVSLKDLTIRPARTFRPALALGATSEAEPALFRVHDGTLRLEGLEFRLRAERGDFKALSLVALAGDGVCALRDCVVTLQRSGDAALALATLVEPSRVLRLDMPPARPRDQGPKLSVKGCFVRGEGDLLWGRANRPFAVEVEETLAALSGSLLNLEVSPEGAAPPESQAIRVGLKQTTTYLGGHLLHVNVSKDPRGLVPLRCGATGCLFLPATSGKTLVHLEGAEGEEKALRDKFTWDGGHNGYGGYTSLLTQENGDGMAAPMGMDKWKMLPGEDASAFGVKMEKVPEATAQFSQMEPGEFKASAGLRDLGASAAKIPRPTRGRGE